MRTIIKWLLLVSLLAQLFPVSAWAARDEAALTSAPAASGKGKEAVTISWLSKRYGLSESEVLQELNKGYSLQELQAALDGQKKSLKKGRGDALKEVNPKVQERLKKVDFSAERFAEKKDKDRDQAEAALKKIPTPTGEYVEPTGETKIVSDRFDLKQILPPSVVQSVYAVKEKNEVRALSSTSPYPDSYDEVAVKRLNMKPGGAPYTASGENVSLVNGALQVQQTDLTLPGRNGLGFALTRKYDSADALYYDKDVFRDRVYRTMYYPELATRLYYKYSSSPVSPYGSITPFYFEPYGLHYIYTSFVQFNGKYTRWGYPNITFYVEEFNNEVYNQLKSAWVYANPDDSSSSPFIIGENIYLDNVYFTAKAFLTGNVLEDPSPREYVCRDERETPNHCTEYRYGYANKIKSREAAENRFPLGKGWSWDIPYIETKENGKKYIHLFGGASYELNGSSLVGYPWKDLTLSSNNSVTVNGVVSQHVLTNLTGQKQYFSADGRLLQISDAYNNTLQLEYATVNPYGTVLTRVRDALNNEINVTYTATEVTLTQGDRTVTYKKSKDSQGNKDLLNQVTDAAGRTTSYVYEVAAAPFNLVDGNKMQDNFAALLKQVYHPTQARTEYTYTPFTRDLGVRATETAYRVTAREDAVTYTDGTEQRLNRVTYGYNGDGGTSRQSNFSFSTTLNNGRTQTTYKYDKVYFDENTPEMLYNTEIKQTDGSKQILQTMEYDRANKRPAPIKTTSKTIQGAVNSTEAVVTRAYDEYGNVTSETNPEQVTITYTYDAATHLLSTVSQPVSSMLTSFLKLERYPQGTIKTAVSNANQASGPVLSWVSYEYDAFGNMQKINVQDDAQNMVVTQSFAYPTTGDVFTLQQSANVKNADGVSSTVTQKAEYSKKTGLLTKLIDGKGNATTYEYDKLGRVLKETLPDLNKTQVTYDDSTNKLAVIDPSGRPTIQEFSPLGLKLKDTVGLAVVTYEYDIYGRLQSSKDLLGRATVNTYDVWDRITKVTYPDLSEETMTYDDVQRTTTTKDAELNEVKESYDILGRSLRTERIQGGTATLLSARTYDAAGNVTKVKDANENETSYSYDALSRLVAVTDPLSQVTKYTYSLGNLLTEIEYADGNKVRKKYDQLGRLIQQTEVSTGLFDKYEYDANSNLVKHVDRSNQSTTYVYNHPRDFLMKSITASETISYTYDAEGKRLSMQDATGLTGYQYKPETGELTKVTYPDGKSISYTYDMLGRRASMTGPFGNQLAYGYDSRNRLEWVGAAENNREATYTYLKNGLLSAIQQKSGVQTSFTLDGPRVTKVKDMLSNTVLNTYEYGYDLNSNLQTRSENGTQHAFTYDKLNRIDTSTLLNEKYTYDARGNRQTLQSDGLPNLKAVDYQYDDRNRLTKVTTAAGTVVSYRYNGDGLLWERTENGSTTRYYYDGANVIAEGTVTAGVSAVKANYIRGNGLVARADASGTKAYYLHNAHGDVTGLRDSSGNVLNTYSYDIWGNPLMTQESVPQPFRYSGELWDSTTSLQYLRARWYDPSMGRFMNEDTYEGQIGNPLSLNLYTYVSNNPLRYTDPTGHIQEGDENRGSFVYGQLQFITRTWEAAAGDPAMQAQIHATADYLRNVSSTSANYAIISMDTFLPVDKGTDPWGNTYKGNGEKRQFRVNDLNVKTLQYGVINLDYNSVVGFNYVTVTERIDSDGNVILSKRDSNSGMYFTSNLNTKGGSNFTIVNAVTSASNELSLGAPSLDYSASIQISNKSDVSFSVSTDKFPAYEGYLSVNGGGFKELYNLPAIPAPINPFLNLAVPRGTYSGSMTYTP